MTSEAVAEVDQVNSDDSIELENTPTKPNTTNGKAKARRVPVKGIKQLSAGSKTKRRATATQREYLISNLNSSRNKQQQQRQRSQAVAPTRSSKLATDENKSQLELVAANETTTTSIGHSAQDQPVDNLLVTSVHSSSSQSSTNTKTQSPTTSSSSSTFLTSKSASPKSCADKMSPGLAKRIQPSIDVPKSLVNSKSLMTTSTCSSTSSSTNATLTPPTTASSSATIASLKIQNALERNMKRLNLNKQHQQPLNCTPNLTEEDMEMFTGKQKSSGYFSGDSLSSTPEYQTQRQSKQPPPAIAVQEFILNQARSKLIPCDREMTPDSINNDIDNDYQQQKQRQQPQRLIPTTAPAAPSEMPCVEEGLSNDELEEKNYEDADEQVQKKADCDTLIDYEGEVYYEEDDDDGEYEDYEEEEEEDCCQQNAAESHKEANKNFLTQVQTSIKNSQIQQQHKQKQERSKAKNTASGSGRGGGVKRVCGKEVRALDTDEETNNLLAASVNGGSGENCGGLNAEEIEQQQQQQFENEEKSREILIEGVLFRARYLGSTQLVTDGNPTKLTRMLQAQEAVGRIKAPDGESQPFTEVDLFVSTEKIMVLNTDLQTDKLEIMMDHSLRSISYIADIGNLVVLMAKRRVTTPINEQQQHQDPYATGASKKPTKMICHVFESDEAQIVAQSIGQAFQVAYMEYLKANGIEDMSIMKDLDYQEVLNQQEIMGDELGMFAKKECQKEVIIPKAKNEILGVVIVESGWGSMLPTVVVANMMPTGPAARCGTLNIGDQIISVNGISLVGLPISACQTQIKNAKHLTLVRLVVVPCPPVVEVLIKRPDTKYQLGFSVQDGIICSLLRGGIAERGGVRVGHRIIEINNQSVVATSHEKIVNNLANSVGELRMKTMPTQMFRLLTGQEQPVYI